jgi:hypothetical protein
MFNAFIFEEEAGAGAVSWPAEYTFAGGGFTERQAVVAVSCSLAVLSLSLCWQALHGMRILCICVLILAVALPVLHASAYMHVHRLALLHRMLRLNRLQRRRVLHP